ncbi:bZIP transcription factor [Paenibacillus azoreducens]|uniref:Phage lipoprotein n=1 Tax=Paenibacillus azoreducens TaxID=116718 RepID=A0A919Y9W2_9BACL|nr:bZIP transcription factor [Paenibacillus azoreducens]GIO46831.1 phage lipoprotein [Paenibacillus azoreducens]
MKYRLLILVAICILSLTACSSNTGGNSSEVGTKVAELEQKVKSLEAENKKLKDQNAATKTSGNNTEATSQTKSEEQNKKMPLLTKNKMQLFDNFAEITITKTKFSKKIEPSSPSSFYTYYEAKGEDTTYLALYIKIKNLNESGTTANKFANVIFKYDDKFSYDAFSVLEENGGGNFTYTNITDINPLSSNTVIFLAEVPKEVETGNKSVTAEVKVNGETYLYKIR